MTKKRMHKNLILVFTAFFSVLMVTSCTTTSSRKSDSRAVADYDMQPAEFYLQQAEAAEEADRAPFLLQAAKAYVQRKQYTQAYDILNSFYQLNYRSNYARTGTYWSVKWLLLRTNHLIQSALFKQCVTLSSTVLSGNHIITDCLRIAWLPISAMPMRQ